jgi:hypothetical protein
VHESGKFKLLREPCLEHLHYYSKVIKVYSNYGEEHVEHLRKVFQRLRENKLYTKFEKCEFGVMKVDFLGHRIAQEGLKMDDHKLKAILDHEPLRSFRP